MLWEVRKVVISSFPLPALDDALPDLGVWLWLGVVGVTLSCMTESKAGEHESSWQQLAVSDLRKLCVARQVRLATVPLTLYYPLMRVTA